MPQIRFHGFAVDHIRSLFKPLVDELTAVVGCPRNYFVLESINSHQFVDDDSAEGFPFVEVVWFDRGLEIQDAVACVITKHLQELGYACVDVAFSLLEPRRYYENGEHL